ncbi:MAG: class I SAM-dependent methyltransferase [Alcanivoracaceae bacterium]|nr:class I SAM-dependent methyltransferase [Alcanivoracaceae bacterium]
MERFETSVRYHAWYEHWHRYHFIKELVKGKKVGDIACGEGYGSAILASSAESVIGVDIDEKTILAAQQKYNNIANLNYMKANALNVGLADNVFDVIVSFETLEHLAEQEQLICEFKRILKSDGVLIISTPDKEVYSTDDNLHNEYHVKELSSVEFDDLIALQFKFSQMFGQQFQLMSVIENQKYAGCNLNSQHVYVKQGAEQKEVANSSKAKYLINICTNNKRSLDEFPVPNWHAFSEANNGLFHHYEEQIQRLLLIDKQNHELRSIVEKQTAVINHLKARLGF